MQILNNQIYKVNVFSRIFKQNIVLEAYQGNEPGSYVILHNSLKKYILGYMANNYAQKMTGQGNAAPAIEVSYKAIETSLSHCIVDCTVSMGEYKVTETGESCIATLESKVAKEYPYLTAQSRAFDRAVISFLQLEVDNKRVYSDQEIGW